MNQLVGYIKLDWARDGDDHKCISSYVFQLGSGPIICSHEKKMEVSLSTIESIMLQCMLELGPCAFEIS